MSDSSRGNTLIVVEGNHEKNELFSLIARCYPELRIDPDNVWIYGTNIYRFYELIVKEYTKKWDEVDIDIPYLISSHNKMDTRWKTEFINIYLFFDYERQDPNFDYDNLKRLQEYFSDETDCGKLYVNYPMIEAYLDFDCMDEDKYINKKIVTNYQKGSIYKNLVSKFSIVEKHILKPQKMEKYLFEDYHFDDKTLKKIVCEFLNINFSKEQKSIIQKCLDSFVCKEEQKNNTVYKVFADLKEFYENKTSYFLYMRSLFNFIIKSNIIKAYCILENNFSKKDFSKGVYESIDLLKLLEKQNELNVSSNELWILATCLFLVPNYNFSLIEDK